MPDFPLRAKLGFPEPGAWFPTFGDLKSSPVQVVGGTAVGVVSAGAVGGAFRSAAGDNAVLSEVAGVLGNVVGTEVPARVLAWGASKTSALSNMDKGVRLGGYATTVISAALGIVRIASAAKKGGVSGLGQFHLPARIKKGWAKVKKAMGIGIFGTEFGLEDVVSSGWEQGYTGFEPLGVSDSLDERIRTLAKELGLSNDEAQRMTSEGWGSGAEGTGYLDYQLAGWGKDVSPSIREMGRYPTYRQNPYAGGMGQYGSASEPLISDSVVPPAELDVFRSDFVR